MAVITISSTVSHRSLMNKTKAQLERLYFENRDRFGGGGMLTAQELRSMQKWEMATEVMRQFDRMPKDKP